MAYQLIQGVKKHKAYRTRLHIRRIPIRTLCGHEWPVIRWRPVLDMTVEQAVEQKMVICAMCLSNWRADRNMETT